MLNLFALILLCQLAGEVIVVSVGISLPGPVVGMVLLFIGLLLHGEVPEKLDDLSRGLLSHLSLLFVPAGVGVMIHAELVGTQYLPIAISLVVSTLVTIGVTGWLMQKLAAEPRQ